MGKRILPKNLLNALESYLAFLSLDIVLKPAIKNEPRPVRRSRLRTISNTLIGIIEIMFETDIVVTSIYL